jgi:hypothetical protein
MKMVMLKDCVAAEKKMVDTTKFPYEKFIYRLEHKDFKTFKICYFECQEHLNKYLTRHGLKKRDVKIEIKK